MEWNNLKPAYQETIENQIKGKLDENTTAVYEYLLKNGYEHEQIVDKLIPYLHDSIMDQEEVEWKERIEPLMEDSILDSEYVRKNQVDKIIKSARKEFGTILKGTESGYAEGLKSFEDNVYTLSTLFGLNSKQVKEVCKIWLMMLVGDYHDINYNLSDACDNDLVEMAKPLVYNCNIYSNDELMEQFKENYPDYNVDDPNVKLDIYTMNIRCILKILDQIDYFMKQYGSNGYIQYLNKNRG